MTEPTTEELVERLNNFAKYVYMTARLRDLLPVVATRLSDLEGKLGEARKALEPFAGWQADCPRCVASKFTCDAHYRASEALKLTASGGGEDNSLSQGATDAHPSVRPETQHSAGDDQ